jgi:sec-independent protein translocase protein TatB
VFDLSFTKILVLAVIALVVFGPNELPKVASQAGRMLRDLRRIAEGAKTDLKEGLGPEFQDFDFDDLNPRRFVQKHLLEEPANVPASVGMSVANGGEVNGAAANGVAITGAATTAAGTVSDVAVSEASNILAEGENPPFDFDAT